jgi:hypothetical protein
MICVDDASDEKVASSISVIVTILAVNKFKNSRK